jgi:ribonuclease P protein subunit RPR2
MERLLEMMRQEALAGNALRSKTYLEHARRLSMRTKTPLPKGYPYCRACGTPLVPGRNCRVRLRSQRVVYHCLACDAKRRIPYIEEKKGAEDGEYQEVH